MPSRRSISCEVCGQKSSHIRRHVNREHMPWYVSPTYACLACQLSGDATDMRRHHDGHLKFTEGNFKTWWLLMNGFLLFLSSCLGLGSVQALMNFVVVEHIWDPQSSPFSEEEISFLRVYDRLSGLEEQDSYFVEPSRVSELFHFKTLNRLIARLSPAQRTQVKFLLSYKNPDGTDPPFDFIKIKIHIIDCHFHLDELVGRYGKSLEELETGVESNFELIHVIANFVYPGKWSLMGKINFGSRISFSLGIHPHLLFENSVDAMFVKLERQFQRYPQAVAVGEVGLDFTTTCRCRSMHNRATCVAGKIRAQHKFLEMSLKLAARLQKPVIIHCRDSGDGSAARGVLDAFVNLGLTHLKVQRHCFIGNSTEFDRWSSILPNCYFSLSRNSTIDETTREALLLSDHRRLLLETDSPYLSFPGDQFHGPWRVGKVAQAVSSIIGLPISEVACLSNRNASKLFGFRQ